VAQTVDGRAERWQSGHVRDRYCPVLVAKSTLGSCGLSGPDLGREALPGVRPTAEQQTGALGGSIPRQRGNTVRRHQCRTFDPTEPDSAMFAMTVVPPLRQTSQDGVRSHG
jgi:hypothetical protein